MTALSGRRRGKALSKHSCRTADLVPLWKLSDIGDEQHALRNAVWNLIGVELDAWYELQACKHELLGIIDFDSDQSMKQFNRVTQTVQIADRVASAVSLGSNV